MADTQSLSHEYEESASAHANLESDVDFGDVYRIRGTITFDGEGVSAQRLAESDYDYETSVPSCTHEEDAYTRLPPPRHRPRRCAAARRAQQLRSDARMVTRLLKGLYSLDSHRGCKLSRIGAAMRNTLEPSYSAGNICSTPTCRHWIAGKCSWGAACRFKHAFDDDAPIVVGHDTADNPEFGFNPNVEEDDVVAFCDALEYGRSCESHSDLTADTPLDFGLVSDDFTPQDFDYAYDVNRDCELSCQLTRSLLTGFEAQCKAIEQSIDHVGLVSDGDAAHGSGEDVEQCGEHCKRMKLLLHESEALAVERDMYYDDGIENDHGTDNAVEPSDNSDTAGSESRIGEILEVLEHAHDKGAAFALLPQHLQLEVTRRAEGDLDQQIRGRCVEAADGHNIGVRGNLEIASASFQALLREANMNKKVAYRIWQAPFNRQQVQSMMKYVSEQSLATQRALMQSLPPECNDLEMHVMRKVYDKFQDEQNITTALGHTLPMFDKAVRDLMHR